MGTQENNQLGSQSVWIAHLIPAAMCVFALLELPYGYYTLLRLVVTGCALLSAYWLGAERGLFWIMALIAVLFNPIMPIHFSRELWAVFDLAVAGGFVAAALSILQNKKTNEQ